MRSSRWFLRTALALPIIVLVGVGIRTWQLEGVQGELDYQSAVKRQALSVVARLERWRTGEAWPGQSADPVSQSNRPAQDPDIDDQLLLLAAGFDRTVRNQGAAAGMQWLTTQADSASPTVQTWLKLRKASLLRQQDDLAAARTIWRDLAQQRIGRDERGIRFDLSARALSLLSQPDAGNAGEDAYQLAVDLLRDQRDDEDFGTAALADRVLEFHKNHATAQRHQELLAAAHPLQRAAAWRGLQAIYVTTTRTAPWLHYTQDRGGWLLAFTPGAATNEVRGISLEQLRTELFPPATVELLDELGIIVVLRTFAGEQLVSSSAEALPDTAPPTLFRQDLPRSLGVITIHADPTSTASANRSERRITWLLALGTAVLAAFVAGLLGLRALRQTEQLNEQRAGFVAAVSHELKTPLTATRLLGELLERGNLDDAKVREFGGRIARESERLDQLVRNVLDLARVERLGLEAGQHAVLNPDDVCREAIERHELAAPDSPPVVLAGRDGPACRVHADRESLLGALANLLENAARHAKGSAQIDVAVVSSKNRVRLEVRDRGPGVPDDERGKVFGEFYRGGSEDTRKARGTGIGLALVARIAKAHHGTAFCEAREGGGAVFVIELPQRPGDGDLQ